MSKRLTLNFGSSSTDWAINKAKVDVADHTKATAEVERSGPNSSGRFVLIANSDAALEKARKYLMTHQMYKDHFTT
jgi:hypothetical protein